MYARSTTVRGDPQALDRGRAALDEDVLPALEQMDGFVGLSWLTDRDSGRSIVTTAWQDERALADSRQAVTQLRSRAVEQFRGAEPEVREWEIATLHREHQVAEGACARVTWVTVPVDRVDRQIEVFRTTVLPRLEELAGFCSASLFVDRTAGRAAGAVVYASRADLDASREATSAIRSQAVQAVGSQVLEVAEFEVALAHLRVPETV